MKMGNNKSHALQAAALRYAKHGLAVLPLYETRAGACACGKPDCPRPGKHPRTRNGVKDASRDPATIREWWTRWPGASIGIATGKVNGLLVLDVDGPEGQASLKQFTHDKIPAVWLAGTGRGVHAYFRYSDGEIRSQRLGPGLDVRGEGSYVVAPPSTHVSGKVYTWKHGPTDNGAQVDGNVPGWLLGALRERKGSSRTGEGPKPATAERILEGERNNHLMSLAGVMRRRGSSEEAILQALLVENATRCEHPLPREEVAGIAHRAARYEPAAAEERDTDLGNAQRLVKGHGEDLRYCGPRRKWFVWDGRRWREDETNEVERRAKETVRSLYAEASAIQDDNRRSALVKHAGRSEARDRIAAMISLARSERGIPVTLGQLDADPWVLNVLNGTLDLRTGELRPHRREDLITKLAPITYDPKAEAPTWRKFLERIMARDEDLIQFLQRTVGYALTGETREQVLFMLYGTGANGKSTFLNTMRSVLGDYAQTTPGETFLTRRSDGPRNDVARLDGTRFVSAVEAEGDRQLAEVLVKRMTGGDPVAARYLYGEYFEFEPTFKIFFAVNHKPIIRGADHAIWRRIRLVPFTVTIPEAEQDRDLPTKLCRELPGILRWAVEGCLEWQREGLGQASAVQKATADYRSEMDVFAAFIAECCEVEPSARVRVGELYDTYLNWCQEAGMRHHLTKQTFGIRLQERGFVAKRSTGARGSGAGSPCARTSDAR